MSSSTYNIIALAIAIALMALISTFVSGLMVRILFVKKASIIKESKNVLNVYFSLLIAGIVYAIAVIAGMIALIIPGIIIAVRLGFYNYSILMDRKGAEESLKTSWKITKNNGWRIFALLLLLFIVSSTFSFASMIIGLVSQTASAIAIFLVNAFIMPLFISIYMSAYAQLKK